MAATTETVVLAARRRGSDAAAAAAAAAAAMAAAAAIMAAAHLDPDEWDDPLASTSTAAPAPPTPNHRVNGVGVAPRSLWGGSPQRTAELEARGITLAQEEAVGARVRHAFDNGAALVDLSDLALENLPPEVLSLRYFTPGVVERNRNQGLSLFLSRNALHAFPRTLLALADTLTVLSLRNNKLRQLPAEIRYLRQLRELSVGGNQLPYLPWEIETLPHLQSVSAQPNPFMTTTPSPAPAPVQDAAPTAATATPIASLVELCLRAMHRAQIIPPVTVEFQGSAGERLPKDKLVPYVQAAPDLDLLPIDLVDAATRRCWCTTCDLLMTTATVTHVVLTAVKGSVAVAVQYRYCSAPCWRQHNAKRAAVNVPAPVNAPAPVSHP